jgi:murein DD-endopeptidase MepM/ murein hydrolase activator NlpD
MKKGLGVVFLFFLAIVAFDYLSTQLGSLHLSLFSVAPTNRTAYDGLPSVNINFFDPMGNGKSYITQGYGDTPYAYLYLNHWHDGIDIMADYGEPIYAVTAGTVLATGNQDDYCYHRGFGKYVAVKDDAAGFVLWYAHLGTIDVSPGANISKGTKIGTVGATGYEFGTHLHFSIFDENGFSMQNRDGCGPDPTGQDRDPIPFLNALQ